jgi:hypothetical protein
MAEAARRKNGRTDRTPAADLATWSQNPIDRFILAQLLREGLEPSPAADRYTLVRRLYLDLIGLPPTPRVADAFVQDDDPQAYEELVDRLLASPHYGERWARLWLDLARYADTNGYEKDRPRSMWLYRDWVVKALNDDLAFDQFSIQQLAGDLLPGASLGQTIATGFHRNTMLNEEGGIDPLEYRFYAMVDRVATTGTVWLGMTTGCAQCHSHKYDPISHTDYYRLMALLNNADEPDLVVPDTRVANERRMIQQQIALLESELPQSFPALDGPGPIEERRQRHLERNFAEWLEAERARAVAWTILRPSHLETNLPRLEVLQDGSVFSSGDITKRDVFRLRFRPQDSFSSSIPTPSAATQAITALRLEAIPDDRLPAGGPGRAYYEGRKGDFFLSEVSIKSAGKPVRIASASHSYGQVAVGSGNANAENVFDGDGSTGWSIAGRENQAHQLVINLAQPLDGSGELEIELLFERHFAASLGRFRLSATAAPGAPSASAMPVHIEALLASHPSRTDAEVAELRKYFLDVAPQLADARKSIEQLRAQLPSFPTTLVMQERPADNPRPTFRHHRGEYLSPREEVAPGLPSFLATLSSAPPRDRLSLARWLVSPHNPLVARVTVNRAWQALLGSAIVRTSGDFGTQADPPTHPELLDWLACEFIDQGWSVKKLHRLIVTSATYRQGSAIAATPGGADPENRLWSRGPRHRVDAEVVRDLLLAASDMLCSRIGGPSVYPPQPAAVTGLAYGNTEWPASVGEDRFRRSLYTFTKRTAPFAAYAVFDAPSGENCVSRRDRSNTPLQALTLLNDEMFLEMARALAKNAVAATRSSGSPSHTTDDARDKCARLIFRGLLCRPPNERELTTLLEFQQIQLQRLLAGELSAAKIGGDAACTPELAAWAMVARVVMNLDETITKQ